MKIKDLFTLKNGNGFELIHMDCDKNPDINFISRSAQNNGVVGKVNAIDDIKPFPAGCISVALGGSVLSSFVQVKPFYTAFHIMVMIPKVKMSLHEKLFYCLTIKKNAFRYGYGRQANKTLKDIELPDMIPDWVFKTNISNYTTTIDSSKIIPVDISLWKEFFIGAYFKVVRGKRIVKDIDYITQKNKDYNVNVITSSKFNNSVDGFYHTSNCSGNTLVCGGEAGAMFTTYQNDHCWVMDRSRIIKSRDSIPMNKYLGLFLATIFSKNQYKYSYGRTPNPKEIENTIIKLPVCKNGNPDWQFMENYIKSLPYSDRI
jgi:restriction endonuclease S subunit